MRHPQTKSVYGYWLELFAQANSERPADAPPALPPRDAVEPAPIRNLLGDVFILDGSVGEARYRIAGSRLCALYGAELRGRPFVDAFAAPDRAGTSSWVRTFGEAPCLVLLSSAATSRHGETVELETLLLPLEHEGRTDRRALGITTPATAPDWVGLEPVVAQDLRAARLIRPWESNVFLANYPFCLPQSRAGVCDRRGDPLASVPRRVGHLHVHEGGRA